MKTFQYPAVLIACSVTLFFCSRAHANEPGNLSKENEQCQIKIKQLSQTIKQNPKDAQAYCDLAQSYYKLGQYKKACDNATRALSLNPDLAIAYNIRGAANLHIPATGYDNCAGDPDFDKCVKDCSKAIELDPKLAVAYLNRAESYAGIGQNEKSLADCAEALKLDPKLVGAYCLRARTLTDVGVKLDIQNKDKEAHADYMQAIKDYLAATEINPHDARIYSERGQLYLVRLKEYQKAVDDFSEALKLNPKDVESYSNRAEAYEKLGKKDLAAQDRVKSN